MAVPALHPLLAPSVELFGFASLAMEESGPGAAGFGTCGFGPALFWQGDGLAPGTAKGAGQAPISIIPWRFSAPLDLLDGSVRGREGRERLGR